MGQHCAPAAKTGSRSPLSQTYRHTFRTWLLDATRRIVMERNENGRQYDPRH